MKKILTEIEVRASADRVWAIFTSFSIEPIGEARLRFVERERFSGLHVPLLSKMLDGDTRRGFEDMNRALKLRAESAP